MKKKNILFIAIAAVVCAILVVVIVVSSKGCNSNNNGDPETVQKAKDAETALDSKASEVKASVLNIEGLSDAEKQSFNDCVDLALNEKATIKELPLDEQPAAFEALSAKVALFTNKAEAYKSVSSKVSEVKTQVSESNELILEYLDNCLTAISEASTVAKFVEATNSAKNTSEITDLTASFNSEIENIFTKAKQDCANSFDHAKELVSAEIELINTENTPRFQEKGYESWISNAYEAIQGKLNTATTIAELKDILDTAQSQYDRYLEDGIMLTRGNYISKIFMDTTLAKLQNEALSGQIDEIYNDSQNKLNKTDSAFEMEEIYSDFRHALNELMGN